MKFRSGKIVLFILTGLCFTLLHPTYSQIKTKIIPHDGAINDYFGISVGIHGDYAVVGAPDHKVNDNSNGAAYIFQRNGTSWIETGIISASDTVSGGRFGSAVAIFGQYIVVSNPTANIAGERSGVAYLFKLKRNGTDWMQLATILPPDIGAYDYFGESVAITETDLVIGAPRDDDLGYNAGAVYVYERNGFSWKQKQKLTASDGSYGEDFGYSVAISGDYLAIGAPWKDNVVTNAGAVYIFKRKDNIWSEQAKLVAEYGYPDDLFGYAVAISGYYVLVGVPFSNPYCENSGSAYLFKRSGSSWDKGTKLIPPTGSTNDYFGQSVAIDGSLIAIGAPHVLEGSHSGAVYFFKRSGYRWTGDSILKPEGNTRSFGESIALDRKILVIGAPGASTGCAYLYHLYSPQLLSVTDVPNDQGGFVMLEWKASPLDNKSSTLSYYSIWRALPPGNTFDHASPSSWGFNRNFAPLVRTLSINGENFAWEWIANQPVHGFSQYSFAATTLYDSTAVTAGKHYFLISAHTYSRDMFYDSNIDSGYSVDNLAPPIPTGLMAQPIENGIQLDWDPCSAPDLNYYVIYRNESRYDSTRENSYPDLRVEPDQTYRYKLTAIDIHNNGSDFSAEVSITLTNITGPRADRPNSYRLCPNYPNPFNSATVIRYQLPKNTRVQLAVFNMTGKQLCILDQGEKSAGEYLVGWNGRDSQGVPLSSGVYWYQLRCDEFTASKKMLLIR